MKTTLLVLAVLAALGAVVGAVDKNNFKTCSQSGFCKRSRKLDDQEIAAADLLYSVVEGSVKAANNKLSADLSSPHSPSTLVLEAFIFEDKQFRVKINEKTPLSPRYEVQDVVVGSPEASAAAQLISSSSSKSVFSDGSISLAIQHSPLKIDVYENDVLAISLNSRQLLEIEYLRTKEQEEQEWKKAAAVAEAAAGEAEEGETAEDGEGHQDDEAVPAIKKKQPQNPNKDRHHWEETFKSHTDKKPKGPEAVSLDISFVNYVHLYGIPEHAAPLDLPDTKGPNAKYSEPYRLYNLDVFEYELDNSMALYGSIPFILAHKQSGSAGILWLNAAETWVDVQREDGSAVTHWLSESGIIDIFGFIGASPKGVLSKYTALTGTTAMPRQFAIAYHQCRWNYIDEKDVAGVNEGFETNDIPYDVLWLDIEHTDDKKYFTWDPVKFPTPKDMQNNIAKTGRKMVTIVDPHIKRANNYYIHEEALALDLYVKDDNNKNAFDGWCWPGSSSWIDFTNPTARQWWSAKFSYEVYAGSTPNLFTWNDMNEPSVFNGPEISMHKHNIHYGGWEHRDVHNVYGFYQFLATSQALTARDNKRPFVLSRAFFAGSQRHGAIWTGDNTADFSHLKASVPMLLSVGVAGLAFAGADVGGFFGNPNPELFTRWYELGAFQPFFRGHAHLDTRRREPWLFGEPFTGYIRTAIRRRYALLPLWYTLFHEASVTGAPVMRPLFFEFPDEVATYSIDDAFMIGAALLVHPVVQEGKTQQTVFLPGGASQVWYGYETFAPYKGSSSVTVAAPLGTIPVFLRGGSIIPRRDRVRRSSSLMANDPYTLIVAVGANGEASGDLYLDDGESFAYKSGSFAHKLLTLKQSTLSSADYSTTDKSKHAAAYSAFAQSYTPEIERIVLVGLKVQPQSVNLVSSGGAKTPLSFTTDEKTGTVTIKKPGVGAASNWQIELA